METSKTLKPTPAENQIVIGQTTFDINLATVGLAEVTKGDGTCLLAWMLNEDKHLVFESDYTNLAKAAPVWSVTMLEIDGFKIKKLA